MSVLVSNNKHNKKTRYLHWLSAVVILWVTISGFVVTWFEVEASIKDSLLALNVLINTIFIPVFIVRVINMFNSPTPEYSQDLPISTRTLAKIAHTSMYVLIFVVLVSGVLMMDRKIEFLDITLIPHLTFDLALKSAFVQLHIFSVSTLALIIFLHIAAVIHHEFSGHKILSRMLG